MKKILLVVLGLVAGSASFANTNDNGKPSAYASIISNDKVKLVVAPMEAQARLDLLDDFGHVLYTSNLNLGGGFLQVFDISKLEKGVYKLSVSVGKERTVKTFDITETPSLPLVKIQN